MRIVVTGATGLIGRNLVAKLVANGDSVAVLTRQMLTYISGIIILIFPR